MVNKIGTMARVKEPVGSNSPTSRVISVQDLVIDSREVVVVVGTEDIA